jgi:succinate dehydrogenase / fumarate reductase cytochrome b subunit
MVDASPRERERPLSPHLQVWRWHITLAASITTRFTGIALYAGWLIFAAFALALASGPAAWAAFASVARSIPGMIVLFGVTLSLCYHLAAGIRHLFFDFGLGFLPRRAELTAWVSYILAVVGAVAIWAVMLAGGR